MTSRTCKDCRDNLRHIASVDWRRSAGNGTTPAKARLGGAGQGLPTRSKSHPITFWYGSRRLRWNSFCCTALLAKAAACSSVCRLSFGSFIHSRMIFRRVSCSSMSAGSPWASISSTSRALHFNARRALREPVSAKNRTDLSHGLYPTPPATQGNEPAKLKAIAAALRIFDEAILATDCDLGYRRRVRALLTAQDPPAWLCSARNRAAGNTPRPVRPFLRRGSGGRFAPCRRAQCQRSG
jgi:hypothetical protein